MRIISLCRFWAVNTNARFCHVEAQMIIMDEMICNLVQNISVNCFKNIFHSQNSLVIDGCALKHFKHPDYKNALGGTFRYHMREAHWPSG